MHVAQSAQQEAGITGLRTQVNKESLRFAYNTGVELIGSVERKLCSYTSHPLSQTQPIGPVMRNRAELVTRNRSRSQHRRIVA